MPPKKMVEVEEPLEAQPPAGILLEEPNLISADEELARLVAEAQEAGENPDDGDDEAGIPVAPVVGASSNPLNVSCGTIVNYVLDRVILDDLNVQGVVTNALTIGDVAPALVIHVHEDGSVNLRVFVDAEAFPVIRGVKGIPHPGKPTLYHTNLFYLAK